MKEIQSEFIDINQLRIGMFIKLDVGWLVHPFPKGSFKVSSDKQIEAIRELGLKRIRHVPGLSDPVQDSATVAGTDSVPGADLNSHAALPHEQAVAGAQHLRKLRSELIASQQRSLMVCERRFDEASRLYKQVVDQAFLQPQSAMAQCLGMVGGMVGEMLHDGEPVIRLLSEDMGDGMSMHPVNVTVLSLLLGRAMGLSRADMLDLGMAAFLHDIGKSQLPEQVCWPDEGLSADEYKLYQEHVGRGLAIAKRMALSDGAWRAIAQHHEMADGSGFPARLKGDSLSMPARILALVNRYDNLCNPARPATALTPHDALALVFTQFKTRFDNAVLSTFVRVMGVYPPGSVVQLVDERFALVVSVNSSRPLKPKVIVHEPAVPRHEALILDLEQAPAAGIRRSLKPASLPAAAMDYLSPRQRFCYFFEQTVARGLTEAKS